MNKKKLLGLFKKLMSQIFINIKKLHWFILNSPFFFIWLFSILLFFLFKTPFSFFYLKAVSFFLLFFLYKVLFILNKKYTAHLKSFFRKYWILNRIGLFLYKVTNIYFYFLPLLNVFFNLLRHIRFFFVFRLNFIKPLGFINFYSYLVYLFFDSIFTVFLESNYYIKAKLLKMNFTLFTLNRLLLMLLGVIFLSLVFYTYGFNSTLDVNNLPTLSYIFFRLFFFSLLIIFIKAIFVFRKELNLLKDKIANINLNRVYLIYSLNAPFYVVASNLFRIEKSRFFLLNCDFLQKKRKNKFLKIKDSDLLLGDNFEGTYIENVYWYKYNLYSKDIAGNLNIPMFLKFFYILHSCITKLVRLQWFLHLYTSKDKKIADKNSCLIKQYGDGLILTYSYFSKEDYFFRKLGLGYDLAVRKKIILERILFYENLIKDCEEVFYLLKRNKIKIDVIFNQVYTCDKLEFSTWYENFSLDFDFNIYFFKNTNNLELRLSKKIDNLNHRLLAGLEQDWDLRCYYTSFYWGVDFFQFDFAGDLSIDNLESRNAKNYLDILLKLNYLPKVKIKKTKQILSKDLFKERLEQFFI